MRKTVSTHQQAAVNPVGSWTADPDMFVFEESDDYGAEDAAPEKDENGNLMNYKGIYFNDDPNTKYTDPITGAHFEFKDMIKRLNKVLQKRQVYENQIAALQQMPKQLLQDMEMGNGAPAGAGG